MDPLPAAARGSLDGLDTVCWRGDRLRPSYVASLHGPLTHRELLYDLRQAHARHRAGRTDRVEWLDELDYALSRYSPSEPERRRERPAWSDEQARATNRSTSPGSRPPGGDRPRAPRRAP